MKLACIGMGSNLGNSLELLEQSWRALGEHSLIETVVLSSPYRTEPVGMESSNWFVNAAGALRTSLEPEQLLQVLLETEIRFGRCRGPADSSYLDRTLDLDLLLYGDHVAEGDVLHLPHPQLHRRMFVLAPLAEIAPDWIHPLLHLCVRDLHRALQRKGNQPAVWKIVWQGL